MINVLNCLLFNYKLYSSLLVLQQIILKLLWSSLLLISKSSSISGSVCFFLSFLWTYFRLVVLSLGETLLFKMSLFPNLNKNKEMEGENKIRTSIPWKQKQFRSTIPLKWEETVNPSFSGKETLMKGNLLVHMTEYSGVWIKGLWHEQTNTRIDQLPSSLPKGFPLPSTHQKQCFLSPALEFY